MQENDNRFSLDLVTPTAHLVFEQVDEVSIPGSEGDFDVLFEHTPFLTTIRPGVLSYKVGKEAHYFAVSAGFAEVIPGRVIVLARTAENAESVSEQRVKDALGKAQNRLEKASKGDSDIDVERAEVALLRATARLKAFALSSKSR
ncbi:MAG TPA: F0F1 ATP synthase subunit epsilon [bacterium]|nr:F0F1 ATP synthase subunit epsilon [bacterium]